MHSHQRARFGFCNDHIWQLNAFKMNLMLREVGLRAGSDTGYRASGRALVPHIPGPACIGQSWMSQQTQFFSELLPKCTGFTFRAFVVLADGILIRI